MKSKLMHLKARNVAMLLACITICQLLSPVPAAASQLCADIFAHDLGSKHQVAKEIELQRTENETLLLMPKDDLLVNAVPKKLRMDFWATHFPSISHDAFLKLKWQEVDHAVRNAALESASTLSDFKVDRSVPLFTVRQKFTIYPQRDFEFNGQAFRKGVKQEIDLTGFLNPLVEYAVGSKDAVKNTTYLELHFRDQSPSELDRKTRIFFDSIVTSQIRLNRQTSDPVSDHIHIVANKPTTYIEKLRARGISDEGIAATLSAYHALAELGMVSGLFKNGQRLGEVKQPGKPPTFSFLQQSKIPSVLKFFDSIVEGRNLTYDKYGDEGTDLKKNYVGARWGTTYSDQNLWGLELRFPGYRSSRDYGPMANAIKKTLDTQRFPFTAEEAALFQELRRTGQFEKEVWFSLDPSENLANFKHPLLKSLAQRVLDKHESIKVEPRDGSSDYPTSLLVLYDWGSHPFFKNDRALVSQIRTKQIRALTRMLNASRIEETWSKSFMVESGIFDRVYRMLGRP